MSASGYSIARPYLRSFKNEMAPTVLRSLLVLKGIRAPAAGRPFRYLDLGCGTGYSLVLFAACYPDCEFLGVDFAPDHIVAARALAATVGVTNVEFLDASFGELLADTGRIGTFDIIATHGVYAWVDDDVRDEIVSLLDRCLVTGGLAYVSYNAMPVWGIVEPFRRLVRSLSEGRRGEFREAAIDEARAFVDLLARENIGVMRPGATGMDTWMPKLVSGEAAYLTHEFLPANARPLWHDEVARDMARARLSFVGSGWLMENFDQLNFPASVQERIAEGDRRGVGETMRDLAALQAFRADVYARGLARVSPGEGEAQLDALEVASVLPPHRGPEVYTAGGPVKVAEGLIEPIVDMLREGPTTVADLLDRAEAKGIGRPQARTALVAQIAGQNVRVAATLSPTPASVEACRRLNRTVVEDKEGIPALASPILGTGLTLRQDELEAFLERPDAEADVSHIRALVPPL